MIGAKIYEIRKIKGYSLSVLAEKAGISKSYLSNIERNLNRNPSIEILKKISKVLEVDLEVLLDTKKSLEKPQMPDKEWIDLANQLIESGIEKDQLQDYKTLIEFIQWQNRNMPGKNKID